ncbi:helix-turn-helix domain-containing protein [Amycolatopsis orientalis]|uniref:helix-turn-helix domain-containing protein n=1 Tax=Amycolatopsis orientalis TaxID=31958 RepID=UPI0003A5B381|nr:helix-turn-helix transcriptional regulator [Amycolatopsis orientalis]
MNTDIDVRRDIGDFLTTRRARITPRQAGLPQFRGKRRVPGLRREEVALLAGISIEYYTRLERGNVRGVSEDVVDRVASALQLNETERAHFVDLVRIAAEPAAPVSPARPAHVRSSVRHLLDAMTETAAYVRNPRMDVLAVNRLGAALYAPLYEDPANRSNLGRFIFADPRARGFYRDWDRVAEQVVGVLRVASGRTPGDRELAGLIDELLSGSEEFRTRWATHDVRNYRTGTQFFRHPVAGDLELEYNVLDLPADPGLSIVAYCAGPGVALTRQLTAERGG